MAYVFKHRPKPGSWTETRASCRYRLAVPFFFTEWIWQWTAYLLSRWAFLEVLEFAGSFSILIGVIAYFADAGQRREQKHYQAWQVINTAAGKGGSGGRIEAMQELNADREPLVGIDVSNAFLQGVNLDRARLRRAILSGVDMRNASLRYADLRDATMHFANLRDADLTEADLSGADLSDADLTGANLSNLRNWRSIDLFADANFSDVRNPPPGFLDWARQASRVAGPATHNSENKD